MAIQINGNGTITGVSVGGLPDGIVDTDMIANSAVTTAKSSGLGTSTRTLGSEITLSNQTTVDFTGFSSSLTRFDIQLNGLSCSNNTQWGIKIGTGSSPDNSGYVVCTGFLGDTDHGNRTNNAAGFYTNGIGTASYATTGIFRFFKVTSQSNKWHCKADFQVDNADNHYFFINGYKNLSGTLDIIQVLPIAGTFDSGYMRLVTYSD